MSFSKRNRDHEFAHDDPTFKKTKYSDDTDSDNDGDRVADLVHFPDSDSDEEDKDIGVNHDYDEETNTKIKPQPSKSKPNYDKERLHLIRLKNQGIDFEETGVDEDEEHYDITQHVKSSSKDNISEEDKFGDELYEAQLNKATDEGTVSENIKKYSAISHDLKDEEARARRQRLMDSFNDMSGIESFSMHNSFQDGVDDEEVYHDDAFLDGMVKNLEENYTGNAKKNTGIDPIAESMKDIIAKKQALINNLNEEVKQDDPYGMFRCLVRYVEDKETVRGMLKRMTPMRIPKSQLPSLSAEKRLEYNKSNGQFSMVSDAVSGLTSLNYDIIKMTKRDIIQHIDKLEKERGRPSSTVMMKKELGIHDVDPDMKWFLRWSPEGEEHGPNTAQQMHEWKIAGFFSSHPCGCRKENDTVWEDPNKVDFI